MIDDALFERSRRVVKDSTDLRNQLSHLRDQCVHEREQLHLSLFESAMLLSETKAYRDDRG